MRKQRYLKLDSQDGAHLQIAKAIENYAVTAYPPGGSECAANSREALLEFAGMAETGDMRIGSRQFPMIRAAIRWYFDDIEHQPEQAENLIKLFQYE